MISKHESIILLISHIPINVWVSVPHTNLYGCMQNEHGAWGMKDQHYLIFLETPHDLI